MKKFFNKYVIIDIILFIIIILLGIYILFFLKVEKAEENSEIDLVNYESIELDDEFKLKDFKILNSSAFYINNEGTTIYLSVENNSSKTYFLQGVTAVVYGENNKVIANLYSGNPIYITSGQVVDYNFHTSRNILSSIKRVEYVTEYELMEE